MCGVKSQEDMIRPVILLIIVSGDPIQPLPLLRFADRFALIEGGG
jgi:hypothetical protein